MEEDAALVFSVESLMTNGLFLVKVFQMRLPQDASLYCPVLSEALLPTGRGRGGGPLAG
jgi:hypothetical protein